PPAISRRAITAALFLELTSEGSPFINSRQRCAAKTTNAKRFSSLSRQSSTVTRAIFVPTFAEPGTTEGSGVREREASRPSRFAQIWSRCAYCGDRAFDDGHLYTWHWTSVPRGRVPGCGRRAEGWFAEEFSNSLTSSVKSPNTLK